MTKERWKPVVGYEGYYEVSDAGRVRRLPTNRILAISVQRQNGYSYVRLSRDGNGKNYRVHRVVLLAHVGPPGPNQVARHLDGNKANNELPNLAWGSVIENTDDKRRHGTLRGARPGEKHHNSKLSDNDIDAIKCLGSTGLRQQDIADQFGVSQSNISKILTGSSRATARAERRM